MSVNIYYANGRIAVLSNKLFGAETYSPDTMPGIDEFLTSAVSYHIRTGKHDQNLTDWQHYWIIGEKIKTR